MSMKYVYDKFETHTWQYIKDTHSDSVKTEIIVDMPPASEFRVHITRFKPGAGADPHTHEWEHAMVIMQGTGRVNIEGEEAIDAGLTDFLEKLFQRQAFAVGQDEVVVVDQVDERGVLREVDVVRDAGRVMLEPDSFHHCFPRS